MVLCIIYYIDLKSHLSVQSFSHAGNSVGPALIGTDLLEMKAVSLRNTKFIFTEPTEPTIHRQKCVNDDGIQSLTPSRLAGGSSSPSPHVFYFN